MIKHVPLESLPQGLKFPHEFEKRIQYDAVRRRLVFDGFMSKADFDILHSLDSDFDYQLAVERLFQACTADDQPGQKVLPALLAASTVALVTLTVTACFFLFL